MSSNVTAIERFFRYVFGIILLMWAIGGGPTWTYVGVYFLATASFGNCPIYWALRINSRT